MKSDPSHGTRADRSSAWRRMSAVALLALTTAVAQASPEKAAKSYEDALQRYERSDLAGAMVQLKNALQADPKMLAAHVLLGKVLARSGELKGAEAAFEEAMRLGVSASEVAVPLGQVYLQLEESRKLLDRISPAGLPPAMQAEVLAMRGAAHAMTGAMDSAMQSFAQARAIDPRSAAPLVAEAPILLRAGERERARAAATQATVLAPDNAAAWYVLGTVLYSLADPAGALSALDRALTLHPKHVDARVARAALAFGQGRDADAEKDLAQLKAWAVVEPRASYLRGALAARKGDAAAAKTQFAEAVGLIDALTPAVRNASEPLLLAGALSHRSLGNQEKAREYLEALLGRNGRHFAAQLALAALLVEAKDYVKAMRHIEALQRVAPDDAQVLFLAGSVHMARRQYVQAAALFERAMAGSPAHEAQRELGFSQVALGKEGQGVATLEKAWARDKSDQRLGVELSMIYARQGQGARAVQTAEAVLRNDPANLALLHFVGNTKGRVGDRRGAREAYQQVLAKDPEFRPAVLSLNWLDIDEMRLDEARARMQKMLARRADDPELLFQLGVLERRAQRPTEALRHWQRASELQTQDPRAGLAVVELHLAQRQPDAGLAAAKALAAKYADNLQVQLALGRAHLAVGDAASARRIYTEATRLAGYDPEAQVLIGRLQLGAGNPDGAAYNAAKALQGRAGDLGALVLMVEVEARRGNAAGVDAALKNLSARYPSHNVTLVTSASVAMSRGRPAQAAANLRTVMDKEPATGTALMLAQAYIAANEADKALAMLDGWARKNPGDRTALKALAEVQLLLGKNDAARKSYAQLVAAEPADPAAMSSYAVLLQRLGDPGAAAMAEGAVKLAPGNPEYADALGWILVQQGQTEAGLRHLREARLRAPGSGLIRYHLAAALARLGRKAEAKEELAAALNPQMRLPLTPDVKRLKSELGL